MGDLAYKALFFGMGNVMRKGTIVEVVKNMIIP